MAILCWAEKNSLCGTILLPALVTQTGTGGAVCKGATPTVEQ
jgi:hypothetical protein